MTIEIIGMAREDAKRPSAKQNMQTAFLGQVQTITGNKTDKALLRLA
ncbi:hypothetical protein [Neisseria animalis]|nr:hypothetical protein [Neisseria animalis]